MDHCIIQMQVLQHQPVLRQCFVLPYVPLLGAGSESGPVWDKLLLKFVVDKYGSAPSIIQPYEAFYSSAENWYTVV